MPLASSAQQIADYITNLGDNACGMERAQLSQDPGYQNLLVNGNVEANIYFTNNDPYAYQVDYYCDYLGSYLTELIQACTTNDNPPRIQGG